MLVVCKGVKQDQEAKKKWLTMAMIQWLGLDPRAEASQSENISAPDTLVGLLPILQNSNHALAPHQGAGATCDAGDRQLDVGVTSSDSRPVVVKGG